MQDHKKKQNEGDSNNRKNSRSKSKDNSSSSDSDEEVKRIRKTGRKGMPKKRFRRIFVGLAVAIFVMSPLVVAILFRSMLDDSIRYVYHQVTCQGRTNELRIIQVTYEKAKFLHYMFKTEATVKTIRV